MATTMFSSRRSSGRRQAPTLGVTFVAGAVFAALVLLPSSAGHAAGDGAVVDHQNPASWTGTGGVADPAHDPNGPCRQELGCTETSLQVGVDPEYWANLAGALLVRLCTPSCDPSAPRDLADLDLYVYDVDDQGARRLFGLPHERPSNADEIVGIPRPSGSYVVRIVTAASSTAPARYQVEASVGDGVRFAATAMGLTCFSAATWPTLADMRAQPPTGEQMFDSCSGFVRRAGEPPLFINLSVPSDAVQPLPTLVMLHGWTGTGGHARPTTLDGCFAGPDVCGRDLYHYNSPWFVTRGYAVISYSSRGHGSSCGYEQDPPAPASACTRGWAQVAERSAEVADTQHLLSSAVDMGIAAADRLGATGGSYGGGQTWLLATAPPWTTPEGTTLQLAAAAPTHGWTSLQNSLAPNGRATDAAVQVPDALDVPYGVLKRGYTNALLNGARTGAATPIEPCWGTVCPRGFVRLNETDPTERHSHIAGWQAFWEAGEPYDQGGQIYSSSFRGKSAYHADDYLTAVANRTARAVPIFAVSGWTDTLFPAVETIQMYRRLKQAQASYPIWMLFNDTGHGISSEETPQAHLELANDRRAAFLDRYLKGQDVDVGPKVDSLPTTCGSSADSARVTAPTWDRLRPAEITLLGAGSQTTVHGGRSAELDGLDDDIGLTCATAAAATPGAAGWSWPAPAGGATILGLPTVSVRYALSGVDATLVAKLWDVPPEPGAARTLITRGVYRLTAAAPSSLGTATFQLLGNHWRVDPGHRIELELLQSDTPVFQADRLPSSLTLTAPVVRLPTPQRG